MIIKLFDIWNGNKKKLDGRKSSQSFTNFKEREIWFCSVGKNIGTELNGRYEKRNDTFSRPVLVTCPPTNFYPLGFHLTIRYFLSA